MLMTSETTYVFKLYDLEYPLTCFTLFYILLFTYTS